MFGAGLLIGVSQIANPLLNGLVIASLSFVVALRRPRGAITNPFATSLKLGCMLTVMRVILAIAFGSRTSGSVLFNVPSLSLPSWLAGISIGGPVTTTLVIQALCQGVALAAVLAIFGACSTLAPPQHLLSSLPRAIYEVGLSLAIALAFLPELVASAQALKAARRLRGRPTKGLAGLRGTLVPIMEGALERSVTLAASMDARGFGRTRQQRDSAIGRLGTMASLVALIIGGAGLLSSAGAVAVWLAIFGVGLVGLFLGLHLRATALLRTSIDEQPFTALSIVVSVSGITAGVCLLVAGHLRSGLLESPVPGVWPTVTPLAVAATVGIAAVGLLTAEVAR